MNAPEYQINDADREARIERLGAAMILARSENQIHRMEARMGLIEDGKK